MRTAVSRPPQTQPVSRPSRSGRSTRPSDDQWPNAIGVPAVLPARRVEPRVEARRRGVGAVLGAELERAVGGDEADAGQRVEREAQAVVAGQRIAPAQRLVAEHRRQEVARRRARAGSVSSSAASASVVARSHCGTTPACSISQPCSMHRHAALAHPVEPGLAVGRVEDVVEGVAAMARAHAGGDGQQVPVVVAEHAGRGAAEIAQPAQRAERVGAAVDQVAEHVEVVARRREGDLVEQPVERIGAALDVADEVVHGCDSATLASRLPPAPAHGRCPPALPDLPERAVRHVGDGAHREPQGAAAGDGGGGRFGRAAMRWRCTTTRPSSSRWCRSASPRSAS